MTVDFSNQMKREAVKEERDASFGPGQAAADEHQVATQPQMHFSAAQLLADRYPAFFADSNNTRSKTESRVVLTVLSLIVLTIGAAWINWDARYFHTDSDLVYNLGLSGGIFMLVTLLYTLRKRARFMRRAGAMPIWYFVHLVAGIVGPVLIIFHTSFTLKAINSTVALVSMLCVIISGIFGRYIYTRIGYRLHQRLLDIRETEERLVKAVQQYPGQSADAVEKAVSSLTVCVIKSPQSVFRVPIRFFALRAKAAKCYIDGAKAIVAMLKKKAQEEGWDKITYHTELARERRFLREHINALVKIGQFHFYERLLIGWRIFHIPLLYILFISGSVHVLAVHMY